MAVPFNAYGVLQIAFVFILFSNFILTMSYLLCETDQSARNVGNHTMNHTRKHNTVIEQEGFQAGDLIKPLMVASTIMLISSCLVFYILVFCARTNDLVGNLRIRKRTASFKVAFLSWILTGMVTIVRLIGLYHYKSEALPFSPAVPWQAIFVYHLLVLFQRTVQSESWLLSFPLFL